MKMLRQEKSVMGGGSSGSSGCGVEGGGGGLRRRAMGGGRALSRKGKEKRLGVRREVELKWDIVKRRMKVGTMGKGERNTRELGFRLNEGLTTQAYPSPVPSPEEYDNSNHRVIDSKIRISKHLSFNLTPRGGSRTRYTEPFQKQNKDSRNRFPNNLLLPRRIHHRSLQLLWRIRSLLLLQIQKTRHRTSRKMG
jgi:hypothetical protein